MRLPFRFPLTALGLLAALTNCATTTEKDRPVSRTSVPIAAPGATTAPGAVAAVLRPDSTGAARSAPDARTEVLATEAADPNASSAADPNASSAADPNAPSAHEASAERTKEKKMTSVEYRQMLATADEAIKRNPKDAIALLQRAKSKSYLHDYPAAQLDYTAALRYLRNNPDAYYNRGVNHLMMKQYKSATADFAGALKYRPDDKESFFGRGVAKMQMFQYKPAVADFTRAIQLDSAYADAWEYRGISYASFDRLSEARRDLERAVKLNPEAAKSLHRYVGNDGREPIKVPTARTSPRPAAVKHY